MSKISLTTRLRNIGNSQGVILPLGVMRLAEFEAGSPVALRGNNRRIVLEAIDDSEAATLNACEFVVHEFAEALDSLEDAE